MNYPKQLIGILFAGVFSVSLFASCYHSLDAEAETAEEVNNRNEVTFQFTPFEVSQQPLDNGTRAITATPSVLLVIDEMGGEVKQVIRLSTTAGGSGVTQVSDVLADLTLNMAFGSHNVYFVAAARAYDSYDADALTVTWDVATANLNYTWAKKVEVNVNSQSVNVRNVVLPLVIGRVELTCNDAQDPDIKQMMISGEGICWTLDLETMKGQSREEGINITLPYTGDLSGVGVVFAFYSFEPLADGTADPSVGKVTYSAKKADGMVLASHTLNNVPVRAGYLTQYSGSFYSNATGFALSIADDWTGTLSQSY